MDVLLIMCAGIIVGKFIFPKKHMKLNEVLQTLVTLLLIFTMGVTLGSRENFLSELSSLGLQSFLFFLIPTGLSILFVYILTERFMNNRSDKDTKKEKKR